MNEKVMHKNIKSQWVNIRLAFEFYSAGAPKLGLFSYTVPYAKEMSKEAIVHCLCGYLCKTCIRLGSETFYHKREAKKDPPLTEELLALNGCWGMGIIFFSGVAKNKLLY